jgi:hypothetical protein
MFVQVNQQETMLRLHSFPEPTRGSGTKLRAGRLFLVSNRLEKTFKIRSHTVPGVPGVSGVSSPYGLRKISSETGSLTLAPGGTPATLTRLFSANGLITMSGSAVGIA